MTFPLRKKHRITPRRSFHPAIIREQHARRAARAVTWHTSEHLATRNASWTWLTWIGIFAVFIILSSVWAAWADAADAQTFGTQWSRAKAPLGVSTTAVEATSNSRDRAVDSSWIRSKTQTGVSTDSHPNIASTAPRAKSATPALQWRSTRVVDPLDSVAREKPAPVVRTAYQGEPDSGAPSLLPASPISMTSQPAPPRRPFPAEDALSIEGHTLTIDCDKERLKLKRIQAITNKSAAEPGEFPPECGLGDERYQRRQFEPLTYSWRATNLAHLPLYFEESRLERYGHALPPVIQPIASAAHFFVSVPLLPYKMGLESPNECVYTLGYYRPGSCAPYHIPGVPLSLRGAIYETGLIGGLFLVH